MRFKFENCVVIKKVIIIKLFLITREIFSTSYFSNAFKLHHNYKIIFLNVIIIIIIVIMYRSQFIYILSTTIVKHQYFETIFINLAIDRMHAYTIRNISFNRKIYFHIYLSIIYRSIFGVHQMN